MGILNVTPDSFSDGGRFQDVAAAVARGRELARQGADVIDVGGESTRPGSEPVALEVELQRVLPVVEALAGDVRVSIDTSKPEVARAAIGVGATLVNDVTASLEAEAAAGGSGWVAMHLRGTPRTMQVDPVYEDVVEEVTSYLLERAAAGRRAGVGEVWIDPGLGFGKTAAHNWALLAALPQLVATGIPVVIGTSRKAFLGALGARAEGRDGLLPVEHRLAPSVATAVRAALDGAAMLRVHDVAATRAGLRAAA